MTSSAQPGSRPSATSGIRSVAAGTYTQWAAVTAIRPLDDATTAAVHNASSTSN